MTASRSRKARLPSLRRFGRPATAVALLAGCLLLASAFVGLAVQGNAVGRDESALRAEIAALESGIAARKAQVAERQTDQYAADKARDLGFVRPGEALVAVEREAGRAVERAVAGQPGRLAKWWAVFFR